MERTVENRQFVERILDMLEDSKELFCDVDGFYYYWPNSNGALSSAHLRIIADELDRLNKPMEDSLEEYFNGLQKQTAEVPPCGGS